MAATAANLARRPLTTFFEKLFVSIHKLQYIAEGMSKKPPRFKKCWSRRLTLPMPYSHKKTREAVSDPCLHYPTQDSLPTQFV
jgi:hypothetical protein